MLIFIHILRSKKHSEVASLHHTNAYLLQETSGNIVRSSELMRDIFAVLCVFG